MKDILSTQELKQIQLFIDNDVLKEAVRKVLLFCLYNSGVLKSDADSNPMTNFVFSFVQDRTGNEKTDEEVGKALKVAFEGIRIIEGAFNDIDSLKEVKEEKKETKNLAR